MMEHDHPTVSDDEVQQILATGFLETSTFEVTGLEDVRWIMSTATYALRNQPIGVRLRELSLWPDSPRTLRVLVHNAFGVPLGSRVMEFEALAVADPATTGAAVRVVIDELIQRHDAVTSFAAGAFAHEFGTTADSFERAFSDKTEEETAAVSSPVHLGGQNGHIVAPAFHVDGEPYA